MCREKILRVENWEPESHWRHCCASHGHFPLLVVRISAQRCSTPALVQPGSKWKGGARNSMGSCHALAASPIPIPEQYLLGRELGLVKMAAVRKAFHPGQRLLFVHRVARHPAASRMAKSYAKCYSDTVTHTGQVSGTNLVFKESCE